MSPFPKYSICYHPFIIWFYKKYFAKAKKGLQVFKEKQIKYLEFQTAIFPENIDFIDLMLELIRRLYVCNKCADRAIFLMLI